jgi:uncharacterized integral membrane protein
MKGALDLLRTAFIVLVASALTIFVLQNFDTMNVTFLGWSGEAPRALIVFISVFVGVVLGWIIRGDPPRAKR